MNDNDIFRGLACCLLQMPSLEQAPGEWYWEDGWPIERIRDEVFYPQPNQTLSKSVPSNETHLLRNTPSNGIESGGPVLWWGDVAPETWNDIIPRDFQ